MCGSNNILNSSIAASHARPQKKCKTIFRWLLAVIYLFQLRLLSQMKVGPYQSELPDFLLQVVIIEIHADRPDHQDRLLSRSLLRLTQIASWNHPLRINWPPCFSLAIHWSIRSQAPSLPGTTRSFRPQSQLISRAPDYWETQTHSQLLQLDLHQCAFSAHFSRNDLSS